MVENALGLFALPLGLGVNFLVNGRNYLVPMAVEEPSVIAAVSNAARLARAGGGFAGRQQRADHDRPGAVAGRARPGAGRAGRAGRRAGRWPH